MTDPQRNDDELGKDASAHGAESEPDQVEPAAPGFAQDPWAGQAATPEEASAIDDGLDRAGAVPGDEPTVVRDATAVMPPAAPAWAGRAEVPAPPAAVRGPSPYPQGEPPPTRTWWTPLLLAFVALCLVAIVVLVAWLMNRDSSPQPGPVPSATEPAPLPTTASPVPPSPTASAEPTATAQLVQIPSALVGMSQEDAMQALSALGLNYNFQFEHSPEAQGTVLRTRPPAGDMVPLGSAVTLVVSLGPQPGPTATPTPGATG